MSIWKHDQAPEPDQLAGYRPTEGKPMQLDRSDLLPDPDITDAEWAAREAQLALECGRYRLAASFAALADRAQAAQVVAPAVPVPLIGSTRDEQPDRPAPMYEHVADQVRAGLIPPPPMGMLPPEPTSALHLVPSAVEGPAGPFVVKRDQVEDQADVGAVIANEQWEKAKTELFGQGRDDTAVMAGIPSPQRCRAIVIRDGIRDECMNGIHWQPGQPGEALAGWIHIDGRLDREHKAVGS